VPVGAMYPGTFDPVTNGHQELVRRAAPLFDRIVVAIAANPHKSPLFDLTVRTELARTVFSDFSNVTVVSYEGLTVEFAQAHDLRVVIRGLRAVSDFEYEFQLASMNRHLEARVETIFLTPTDEFNFLSSTLVREVASLGGDIGKFVHPVVAKALRERFKKS
jgi:pantetheine-phosphate adenylyltransferase